MSQPLATTPGSTPAPAPTTAPATMPFQIVGDKTNGYVIFDPNAGTVRTFDLKNNRLGPPSLVPKLKQAAAAATPNPGNGQSAAPASTPAAAPAAAATAASTPAPTPAMGPSPDAPAALAQGIAGNATSGVVYFIGNQMAFLADVGNQMQGWKKLRELPFSLGTNIAGICGDVVNGIVVHDGELLALAPDVLAYPTWQSNAISPRLPITQIAGDCTNGVVVVCEPSSPLTEYEDENMFLPTVYRYSGKTYGPATPVQEPKVKIELLFGDGANGFMAYGEHQVYQLDLVKGWVKPVTLEFGLNAVAGNPKDGLVAVIGADNFVVASTDLATWTLKLLATPPVAPPVDDDSGTSPSPNPAGTATQGQTVVNGASAHANAAAMQSAAQSPTAV